MQRCKFLAATYKEIMQHAKSAIVTYPVAQLKIIASVHNEC